MNDYTREQPFYLRMEDMTLEEIINLKKALDDNKTVGGVKFQTRVIMYMQIPESHNSYGAQFFRDMEKIGVDPNKGDWFP